MAPDASLLRPGDVRALLRLVHELHQLPPGPEARKKHLLQTLCRFVGAGSGSAVLIYLEPATERRIHLSAVHTGSPPASGTAGASAATAGTKWAVIRRYAALARRASRADAPESAHPHGPRQNPSSFTPSAAEPAGGFAARTGSTRPGSDPSSRRGRSPGDVAARAATARAASDLPSRGGRWRTLPAGRSPRRIEHRILAPPLPAGGMLMAAITLSLTPSQRRLFSARDRLLVALLHSELGWLYQPELALVSADVLKLTPRQQQTLHSLLAGHGEKQIARQMGLSPNTVHHHVKAVYKHFRVSSRSELLARWVRE